VTVVASIDHELTKRARTLFRYAKRKGALARVKSIVDTVAAEPEFSAGREYPAGHVPRPRYKQPTGRNAGIKTQAINYGLSLNPKDLTDGARERLTVKWLGDQGIHRSQSTVHRWFKGSTEKD
jgi:hypothetical protein